MEFGLPGWPRQRLFKISVRVALYLQLILAFLCLAGIGFLLWFYFTQNKLVAEAFRELSQQEEKAGPLTPAELGDLTHKACLLDPGISNVQSFLQPLSDTLSSGGWCGNYVRVFINFAGQAGYPAHKFHIQSGGRSHTLAEVYYQGQWRIIDPFFNQVYLLPSGEMATYQQLRDNPGLLERPAQLPLNDPSLEGIYDRYVPIFPALYRDAPDFYLELGRSAIYHNGFVLLSYPLSPFYEGGRRPILPSWLDRPELLGTYTLSVVFLVAVTPLGVSQFNNLQQRRKS